MLVFISWQVVFYDVMSLQITHHNNKNSNKQHHNSNNNTATTIWISLLLYCLSTVVCLLVLCEQDVRHIATQLGQLVIGQLMQTTNFQILLEINNCGILMSRWVCCCVVVLVGLFICWLDVSLLCWFVVCCGDWTDAHNKLLNPVGNKQLWS